MNDRDKFAMAAMQALISEPRWFDGQKPVVDVLSSCKGLSEEDQYADAAYILADAMLKRGGKW